MSPSEPSLRDRQAADVRARLRRAFVELIAEHGPNGFPLTDVAEAAGVSERTLYRHYESREALIEGVVTDELANVEQEIVREVGDRSDLDNPELVAQTFRIFEDHAELIAAARMLRTSGVHSESSAARTAAVRREITRHVPPPALDQMVGLIRALTSSDVWLRLSEEDIALDSTRAGHAVQWAIQVLLREAAGADGPLAPAPPEGT